MTIKTDNHAEEQAAAQYSSIVQMLAAVSCDYDRLQELRSEREELAETVEDCEAVETDGDEERRAAFEARAALAAWDDDNAVELNTLEGEAGECTDEDEARQIIQEDALDVQVRSDWENPGAPLEAVEFMILLCTGGPAVRIVGELNRGEPCRAWLEYQDWGTPWTQWFGASSDTLCEYASNFFFGE
jgi:hypothetical protein